MKSADEWYEEGQAALELSRSADHHSEYVSDLEDAVTAFREALELDTEHAGASRSLAFSLARLGRHAEAEIAFESALAIYPNDADLMLARAQSLQQAHDLARALAAYDRALQARPNDPEALYGRAEVLETLRRNERALEAWEAVLRLPDNRAINHFGQRMEVLTTDLRTLRAFLSRASALARLGRNQEAEQGFAELLIGAWIALHGPLLQDRFADTIGELEPARRAYRLHVHRHRTKPEVWRLAGDTYSKAGLIDDALAAHSEAVNLAPDDGDAVWRKGEALAKAGRLDEAVGALRQALTLHPIAHFGIAARLKVMEAELARVKGLRWKLMGHDTFAREDYLVGEFDSAEEAEHRLREKESAVAETQDEPLRDTFWILSPEL